MKKLPNYKLDVSVGNKKYRVILDKNYRLFVFRYEELWRECTGDNLIYNLAAELDEARNEIKKLKQNN